MFDLVSKNRAGLAARESRSLARSLTFVMLCAIVNTMCCIPGFVRLMIAFVALVRFSVMHDVLIRLKTKSEGRAYTAQSQSDH